MTRKKYGFRMDVLAAGAALLLLTPGTGWPAGALKAQNRTVSAVAGEPGAKTDALVTFMEFGSVKCVPCKMMRPVMAEIEKNYGLQVNVVFHDVWTEKGRPLAEQYQIRVIPTQVFLDKNGREFYRHMGFFPAAEIVKILKTQGVK